MKLFISPKYSEQDNGDGGIRRVVEAQHRHLPSLGVTIVDTVDEADVVAIHAGDQFTLPPSVPMVSHSHGLYWAEYEWPRWAIQTNARVIENMRQANLVTAPSQWVAQAIRRGSAFDVTVINHGVDIDDWPHVADPTGPVLWNKTRIDPVCDPRPLHDLAALLPDTQFLSTYDSGQSLPNLRTVGRLSYDSSKSLMVGASVYLCTSRETFGIGTLEAMASGLPVLGFRWGGQAEIITQNEDGVLVKPGDINALRDGLAYIRDNWGRMSHAARAAATRYKWEDSAKRYLDVYQRVLDNRSTHWGQPRPYPVVSVIVTCYNLSQYLTQCVQSVLNSKTDTPYEILIVDDASPDNTAEIAASLAATDHRIRVITNKDNQYLAEARNVGIGGANGRYILPLDADDLLSPVAIDLLAKALDSDRTIAVAYGSLAHFNDGEGDLAVDGISDPMNDPSVKVPISGWPQDFQYAQQMAHRNQLPYSSMYRHEVWEQTGGYRRRLRTAEDADFWCRISSYGFRPKKVTDAVCLIYRNRADSMSRREGEVDWTTWFPWSRYSSSLPMSAVLPTPPPVLTYEPTRVSVIIPCGPDHLRYLIDAIDSVDAQTYRRFEVVVANDTQIRSESVFRAATRIPQWVRVVDTGNRGTGVANARNLAIEASRGQLVIPLDADDYLQPDAIESMVDAYDAHGGVVYSDWYKDMGDGKLEPMRCEDWDPSLLTQRAIYPCTCLFNKDDYYAAGGYDTYAPGWEDWDFALALALIGLCGTHIARPLMSYRIHTGARREDNFSNVEANLAYIRHKYSNFQGKGDVVMACRSCGGGGGVRVSQSQSSGNSNGNGDATSVSQSQSQPQSQPVASQEMVLLTYTGPSETYNIRGRGSLRNYRFGKDPSRNTGFVLPADAEFLMSTGQFVKGQDTKSRKEPQIVASRS